MRVLVTGGVRSGKSRHAEELVTTAAGDGPVRYVAPGPTPGHPSWDDDWAARVAAHRERRPAHWSTVEGHDLAAALATDEHVLVDCLGTWLTAALDAAGRWDDPSDALHAWLEEEAAQIAAALGPHVVLVTNEVGLGVVPAHRSGRLFRDLLGTLNQRLGAACDEVHLVVAGRVLRL